MCARSSHSNSFKKRRSILIEKYFMLRSDKLCFCPTVCPTMSNQPVARVMAFLASGRTLGTPLKVFYQLRSSAIVQPTRTLDKPTRVFIFSWFTELTRAIDKTFNAIAWNESNSIIRVGLAILTGHRFSSLLIKCDWCFEIL